MNDVQLEYLYGMPRYSSDNVLADYSGDEAMERHFHELLRLAWMPISEYTTNDVIVLAAHGKSIVISARGNTGRWYDPHDPICEYTDEPTHFMPLPPLLKDEK